MLTSTLRARLVAALVVILAAAAFSSSPALAADPPIPSVSVAAPASPLIGDSVALSVTFTNDLPTQPGYGPYIDLRLPLGADGDDGIALTGATYLGAPVTVVGLTADGTGCVTHPYAVDTSGVAVRVCGLAPGQAFVVLRLPFGSFTPGQPAATVVVAGQLSPLADAGTALQVGASGGFQFGSDPLANPADDPSVVGAVATTSLTPTPIRLAKTYGGPENETATGPNFERSYTLTATVAPGQLVTALVISDALPETIQFVGLDPTSPASAAVTTPSTAAPGGTLARHFASVTGTGGADASVPFRFNVPRASAAGTSVLAPATGAFTTSTDSVTATGFWTPLDPRDAPTVVTAGPITHILTDKSVAIQKSVALVGDTGPANVSPGDILEWTLRTQVSDFFALATVVVDDRLLDGTRVDATFAPTLAVAGNGFVSPAAPFALATHSIGSVDAQGVTALRFRVSDELAARTLDPRLVGGCVDPVAGSPTPSCAAFNDGATTATIVFRSVVQATYIDGAQVVEGDALANQTAVTGTVLGTGTFTPTGSSIGDGSAAVATPGSSASIAIPRGSLSKSVYAINGSTTFATPVRVAPGDDVTYRLTQTFPSSRTNDFRITDWLPLPIFAAASVTTFDPTSGAAAPPVGSAKYGPSDTFHALAGAPGPTLTTHATANSVEFSYGDYAALPPTASVADLLFTVRVSSDPFADGLLLTNQARSQTRNAAGSLQTADAIVQLTLNQPVLAIAKGVVATTSPSGAFAPLTPGPVAFTNPASVGCPAWLGGPITSSGLAAEPMDSDLSGVDAGDLVQFAIVIENSGHATPFGVRVADTLPTGFSVPAGGPGLCVTDGAGAPLATIDVGGGAGLFDQGIQLVDDADGSLAAGVAANGTSNAGGTNLAVVTYTLQVGATAVPESTILNTASLLFYANAPAGANHLAAPLTDDARVSIPAPTTTKSITGSDQAHTTLPAVAVGEIITYEVTITIPEGTLPGATVTDTLPTGLALVDCVSVTGSPGVSTTLGGDLAAACAAGTNPAVAGSTVTFSLGTLTNADRDNAVAETVTLAYRAAVLNVGTNIRGTLLHNSARLGWTGGNAAPASAPDVRVVEPVMTVAKTASPTSGDAGDTIQYDVTIRNPANANGTSAFDVIWSDPIPAGMSYVAGSLQQVSGPATTTLSDAGVPVMAASWASFADGATAVLRFRATFDASVSSGSSYVNTASAAWTGLPGDARTPLSPFSPVSTERTGSTTDPGSTANTYRATGSVTVSVTQPAPVKTLVTTSEAGTAGTRVVVGEIARFRVVVRIPEGVTSAVSLADTLPAGLRFLDDGTATLALVSGGGLTSSTLAGPGLVVAGDETTVGGVTPTFGVPAGAISGGPFVDGSDPVVALGALTNADRDPNQELVVLEFNALTDNVAINQAGQALADRATIRSNGVTLATSGALTLTVAEPSVTLTKVVTTTPVDAGDPIVYSITLANAAGANVSPAHELRVQDVLDAALVPGTVTVAGPGTWSNASTPAHVDVTFTRLDPGTSVIITINATVGDTADAGLRIPNTAPAAWSSLPGLSGTDPNGTGSSTPGLAGSPTGERTGADGVGGALNDYAASGSGPVTLAAPSIQKLGPTPASATIGATTTFDLVVTLPEGTTRSLAVVDTLPAGLAAVSATVVTGAASSDGRITADFSGSLAAPITTLPAGAAGGAVTLLFGDTLVPADGSAANDRFLVRVLARVANVTGNQAGGTLVNTAGVRYVDPVLGTRSVPAPTPRSVLILEPTLRITKTAAPTNPRFGDVVTYTLVVDHAPGSSADAFDVTLDDVLPAGMTYVASSLTHAAGLAPDALDEGGGTISAAFTGFPLGSSSTLSYRATVAGPGGASIGQALVNRAAATWTSLAGADASERTGVDGSGSGLNDYAAATAATVTVGGVDLSITKTDGATTATAGALLAYVVDYANAGNVAAAGTQISETVPGRTTFVAASSSPGWSCADGAGAGTTCTLTIGTVAAGGSGSVTFAVRVVDPLAAGASFVVNSASIADDGTHGVDPTPADNGTTDIDMIPQADLALAKVVDVPRPGANQVVTFTVTLSNAGPAIATNVVVRDALPAGLTFVSATPSQGAYAAASGDWTAGSLPVGGTATLQVRARVTDATPVTNVAEVARADQADPDSTPDNGAPGEDDRATAGIVPMIADLGITKAVDVAHPDAGTDVTFTLIATNHGPDNATGVRVDDPLPAGLAYVSATADVGSYDDATGRWTIGGLAVGATATLNLTATVTSPGSTSNVATVSGDPFDPEPANDSDAVTVDQLVDLAVTKSVDDAAPNVGSTVTFTVGVTNLGPGTAHGVVIRDLLPAGLALVAATPDHGTFDGASGAWAVGTIAPAGAATLRVEAHVVDPSPVTNTATVHAVDEPQASTANDDAGATITPQIADLAVTKAVDDARPDLGDTVTFTITLDNLGPDAAANVALSDLLPAALGFVDAAASAGSYDEVTGTWSVGTLGNGASTALVIRATVLAEGDITNTASVSARDQHDPDPSNDTDDAFLTTRIADVGVEKVVDDPVPAVGATVEYTITATNEGPDRASQVVVRDVLPAGLVFVDATASQGAYDAGSGEWSVGSLVVDASASMTLRALVVGSGTIDNSAEVARLLQRDPNPDNDRDVATLVAPPAADLSLLKSVDDPSPERGDQVTFRITVSNHGPDGTSGVSVSDQLPAGLEFVSAATSQGSYAEATGAWAVGDLAVGASATLDIIGVVETVGQVTNTAEVSGSDLPDPNSTPANGADGEDDLASATINGRGIADLALTKRVAPKIVAIGGTATYTLRLSNRGPDTATNVVVRDRLPGGVDYVSHRGGAYNPRSGAWTVGTLETGRSVTLRITVRVTKSGAIANRAEVQAVDQRDPNSTPDNGVDGENDQATAVLGVRVPALPPTATAVPPSAGAGPSAILVGVVAAVAGLLVLARPPRRRRFRYPARRSAGG